MRSEVPHLTKQPSHYIENQVWFTTQPVEEPERREYLIDLLKWVGFDRLLISTDYPHWDFDDPRFAFKSVLTDEQKRMVCFENAHRVFGFNS
jgi:predicted TIM-barrel fold metal-dependent hydrolase